MDSDFEMTNSQIESLIKCGETDTLAFCEGDIESLVLNLAALSNTAGGILLIGVNHKAKVIGCNPNEILNKMIYPMEHLMPRINISHSILEYKYKLILKVDVLKGQQLYFLKDNGEKVLYIRSNSIVVKANKIIKRFLELKSNFKSKEKKAIDFSYNINDLKLLFLNGEKFSLSQLYNLSNFSRSDVEYLLINLLLLDQLDFEYVENQCYYFANKS